MGITSEALKDVMDYLFEKIGVNRVEARHNPRNSNSEAVMKKCGMKFEGTLRKADWKNQGEISGAIFPVRNKNERWTIGT